MSWLEIIGVIAVYIIGSAVLLIAGVFLFDRFGSYRWRFAGPFIVLRWGAPALAIVGLIGAGAMIGAKVVS